MKKSISNNLKYVDSILKYAFQSEHNTELFTLRIELRTSLWILKFNKKYIAKTKKRTNVSIILVYEQSKKGLNEGEAGF